MLWSAVGIILKEHIDQLDELESTLIQRTEDVGKWLEENYPIPDFENTISNPLKRH